MADAEYTTVTTDPEESDSAPRGGITPEQANTILMARLDEIAFGMRIQIRYQGPFLVVFSRGQPVNHVLHAIMTFATFGLWALVWIIVAWRGGEQWTAMTVDEGGQLRFAEVPSKPRRQ